MIVTRRSAVLGAAALALSGGVAGAQGRGLRVAAAGQPAALLVQAVRPDALLGWPRDPGARARAALPASTARLPVIGELNAAGRTANLEALAALRPDMVVDYGALGPRYREAAEAVRRGTGLQVRLLDGVLTRTPSALREAGALLRAEAAGERLARFAQAVLSDWSNAARPEGPRFYYGRGPDGLEAGLAGSLATETLEGAGWRNVARGGAPRGLARVSLEQVLAWDPDVVLTLEPAFAAAARRDPRWSRRRSGRPRPVLLLPSVPFGWTDRPPSVNRLLGCAWAAAGGPFGGDARDLVERVREFHALFYGRAIGAAEARSLVRSSLQA